MGAIRLKYSAWVLILGLSFMAQARAEVSDSSNNDKLQPYIERVKRSMPNQQQTAPDSSGSDQPYIDSVKGKLKNSDSDQKSYIDQLKQSNPSLNNPDSSSSGYSDQLKSKLDPKPEGGAIADVAAGKSDLEFKKPTHVRWEAGLRVGVSNSHAITAPPAIQGDSFSAIYGSNWAPDVTLFGEFQTFHHAWLGSLGLIGSLGYTQYKGKGQFSNPNLVYEPPTGPVTPFGASSHTIFRFNMLPLFVGADYRFNLFKYVRPYARLGGNGIFFFEDRNDGGSGHDGKSLGFEGAVGVAFMLDFLSRQSTMDLYYDNGILHSYFTVEFVKDKSTAGDVSFDTQGVYAGISFEL
jgi:hypothetical protein